MRLCWFINALKLNDLNTEINFNKENDLVLGVLGEISNLLISKLKKRFEVPYYLFFHDDHVFGRSAVGNLLTAANALKVMNYANCIFSVSDPMTEMLLEKGVSNVVTLYPIPEGYNGPRKDGKLQNNKELQLLSAGSAGPVHYKFLQRIGRAAHAAQATFHCVSHFESDYYQEFAESNVIAHSSFPTVKELFEYIITNIDVLVVFYTFDAEMEPRLLTSFPSKFTEYCHLGLPILIIAPPESTLGKWSKQNNWISYVGVDEAAAITREILNLKDVQYREKCADQSLKFAGSLFNPAFIHAQLEKHLQL